MANRVKPKQEDFYNTYKWILVLGAFESNTQRGCVRNEQWLVNVLDGFGSRGVLRVWTEITQKTGGE